MSALSKNSGLDIKKASLKALEWPRFQEELASRARSPVGQALSRTWAPAALSLSEASLQALAVQELFNLKFNEGHQVPVGEGAPLEDLLNRIFRFGNIDVVEFRTLVDFQRCVIDLHHFLRKYGSKIQSLAQLCSSMDRLEDWFQNESRLLDPQGEIVDDASEDLAALRDLARDLHRKIRRRLEDFLKNSRLSDLLQDDYVTLRDGRYVLPIKSNYKGKVPGIIHDVSNSEATLFIEPEDIVEWNNQLKVTEKEIQYEIERILGEVVQRTQPLVEVFRHNQSIVARCDLMSAFVQLALDTKLPVTQSIEADEILFEEVSHPLLQLDRSVVSNSLSWEKGFLLTGPNTGGKTVLLKAVGLNVVMARSGFPCFAKKVSLPADLKRVFVSIGDEQNLKENLSTFSAHLKVLGEMYDEAQAGDLVLVDEIATGTSPEEGQPLAQSFIEKLLDRQVRLFVTTHYGALKQFALADERCRIASMSFDLKNKRPTYQLILDVPGESSAFDTASSVGFPEDVLKRARELRGEPSEDLTRALEKLEEARQKFNDRETELTDKVDRAKRREEQAQKVIEEYGLKQKVLLAEESQKLIKDLSKLRDELSVEVKKLSQDDLKAGATKAFQKISDAAAHVRVQVSEQSSDDISTRELDADEISVGNVVEVEGLGLGEILEVPSGNVTGKTFILVQVGELKTRVARERLKRVSGQRGRNFRKNKVTQEKVRETRGTSSSANTSNHPSGSLICDVRGKTLEDALRKVEQSLNSLLGGSGIVTIIHGHGTSKLRDGIRSYLEKSRSDISFRAGSWPGEGGDGVTLAELA